MSICVDSGLDSYARTRRVQSAGLPPFPPPTVHRRPKAAPQRHAKMRSEDFVERFCGVVRQ